jgi:hypothetical protein
MRVAHGVMDNFAGGNHSLSPLASEKLEIVPDDRDEHALNYNHHWNGTRKITHFPKGSTQDLKFVLVDNKKSLVVIPFRVR